MSTRAACCVVCVIAVGMVGEVRVWKEQKAQWQESQARDISPSSLETTQMYNALLMLNKESKQSTKESSGALSRTKKSFVFVEF